MELKVCSFPDYVGPELLEHHLPGVREMLHEAGIKLVRFSWDGTLEGIPDNAEPVIVRPSSLMKCHPHELARLCNERGHLALYEGTFASSKSALFFECGFRWNEQKAEDLKSFLNSVRVHHKS